MVGAELVVEPFLPAADEVAHRVPRRGELRCGCRRRSVPGEGERQERQFLVQDEMVGDAGTAGAGGERLEDALAGLARQPVARQRDERREARGPGAEGDDDVARPPGRQDRLDVGADLRRRRREEVVLREHVEDGDDRLVVVAARDDLLRGEDLAEHASQQRNLRRLLRVGLRGEEADETPLADHPAGGIELPDADVVHARAAVDGRGRDRLGDGEEAVAEESGADRLGQLGDRPRAGERRAALAPQQAEAGSRTHEEHAAPPERQHLVLAVAEEDEAAVHEPVEEVRGGAGLRAGGGAAPREPVELGRGLLRPGEHRAEVVGHEPHVAEPVARELLEPGERRGVGGARDGDVHERLAPRAAVRRRKRDRPPREIPLGPDDGVEQPPHGDSLGLERGLEGVDDEGTVGHDRLDDRHGRVPALGRVGRRDRADPQLVARPGVEPERGGDERGHLLLGERRDVVLRALQEELREGLERGGLRVRRAPLQERTQPLADDRHAARSPLLVGRHSARGHERGDERVGRTEAAREEHRAELRIDAVDPRRELAAAATPRPVLREGDEPLAEPRLGRATRHLEHGGEPTAEERAGIGERDHGDDRSARFLGDVEVGAEVARHALVEALRAIAGGAPENSLHAGEVVTSPAAHARGRPGKQSCRHGPVPPSLGAHVLQIRRDPISVPP